MDITILTFGAVAKQCGVPVWAVRRLYERGLLPEPARAGAYRIVTVKDLPAIRMALRQAGYIGQEAPRA